MFEIAANVVLFRASVSLKLARLWLVVAALALVYLPLIDGANLGERWLGKSGHAAKWSFCLKAASMAAEQEIR